MTALFHSDQTLIIRSVTEADVNKIGRLLETAWRMHLRMTWRSLRTRLVKLPGLLVEDQVGLRGFMIIEPQEHEMAVIVAAGLRDTWGVRPYLDLLLPQIGQLALKQSCSALVYIGHEAWLIEALQQFGFQPKAWIITFERFGYGRPPNIQEPAVLRSAHRNDLATLRALDALAFDHLWRKPASYFRDALAAAGSFVVAEIEGQIVGYEWCEIYQQRGHLTRLAIHPDFQGRGIGAQLLQRAIRDATRRGVNLMTLNTQETNHRSRALYARFGFTQTEQRVPLLWKDLR